MRIIHILLVSFTLSGCTAVFGPEPAAPAEQSRQQSCQNESAPSESDCGHFPAPSLH